MQLEQSPYLNIFPEERARETLRLMERSHDEKITREVGREICQRRGIKALLVEHDRQSRTQLRDHAGGGQQPERRG